MRTLAAILLLAGIVCVARAQAKPADLYNLGPIGGKASLTRHDGKPALSVVEVFKDGPGARAGLKAGDLICGFETDAYLELADDILAAEAGEGTQLELVVKRGNEDVSLKFAFSHYADDATRDKAILDAACKWLAQQQDSEGAFRSTISPEVSQVVLTSLAGMVWLGAGYQPHEGEYSSNIVKAAEFVMEHVGEQKQYRKLQGKNNDQTNWSLGYGGIFLAHVCKAADEKWLKRGPLKRLESKLKWVRDRILKQAEDDGGFGAGPGGANLLGYVHLEIVSNLCVAALGCIRQAGVDVPADKLGPLLGYIEKCIGEEGGVHYSHDKMWGAEVGRTAGAMNALAAAGAKGRESYDRMKAYFEKNRQHAFGGHSTPTMHQLAVAIACAREGLLDDYRKEQRREFTMVRCPDFTFASRPTADTQRLGMNLDRDLGPVWTTTHWALIVSLRQGGCPLWVNRGA